MRLVAFQRAYPASSCWRMLVLLLCLQFVYAFEVKLTSPEIIRPGIAEAVHIQVDFDQPPAPEESVELVVNLRHGSKQIDSQSIQNLPWQQAQAGLTLFLTWPQRLRGNQAVLSVFVRSATQHHNAIQEIYTPTGFLKNFGTRLINHPAGAQTTQPDVIATRNQVVRLMNQPAMKQSHIEQALFLQQALLAWQGQPDQGPKLGSWHILRCPATDAPFPIQIIQPAVGNALGVIDYWSATADTLWPTVPKRIQQLADKSGAMVIVWPSFGGWDSWAQSRCLFAERPTINRDLPRQLVADDEATQKIAAQAAAQYPNFWQAIHTSKMTPSEHLAEWQNQNKGGPTVHKQATWAKLLQDRCAITLAPAEHRLMAQRQQSWLTRIQQWAAPAQCQFPVIPWEEAGTFDGNLIILGPNQLAIGETDPPIQWGNRKVTWPNGTTWRAEAIASMTIAPRRNHLVIATLSGEADLWPTGTPLGKSWTRQQVLAFDPDTPQMPRVLWRD